MITYDDVDDSMACVAMSAISAIRDTYKPITIEERWTLSTLSLCYETPYRTEVTEVVVSIALEALVNLFSLERELSALL